MASTAKLPSGRYRTRVFIGRDENGTPKYKSFSAKSKREAERRANDYLARYCSPTSEITFIQAADRYICSKEHILSPSTITGYRTIYRNYLRGIGNIQLSNFSNEALQIHLNNLAVNHSPKTLDNIRSFIAAVLKMYHPSFRVNVKTPAKRKSFEPVPTDEDIRKLIEAASGTEIELPLILAAFGSLRRSEISGLYPDCVFDDHISIRRVYVQAPDRSWILKDHPKSYAGYRTIFLHKDIMAKLHEKCSTVEPGKSVFNLLPHQIYSRYETIIKKAGIHPYRFHSLRHYFATFSHAMGIPDQYIAKMGGWNDVATLQRIYQHTTKEVMDTTASLIANHYKDVMNQGNF